MTAEQITIGKKAGAPSVDIPRESRDGHSPSTMTTSQDVCADSCVARVTRDSVTLRTPSHFSNKPRRTSSLFRQMSRARAFRVVVYLSDDFKSSGYKANRCARDFGVPTTGNGGSQVVA